MIDTEEVVKNYFWLEVSPVTETLFVDTSIYYTELRGRTHTRDTMTIPKEKAYCQNNLCKEHKLIEVQLMPVYGEFKFCSQDCLINFKERYDSQIPDNLL